MRFGIVGTGFGLNLIHSLANRADVTLAAVADRRPERDVKHLAEHYGAKAFEDGAEMVRAEELDALVVATPPHRREAVLDAARDADLPVFLEKPVAATPAQSADLFERYAGVRIMVGFSFRYHAPVRRLRQELAGRLGAPLLLNAEYLFNWLPDPQGWLWDPARGGGFFNENSCHLFDVVLALMGRPSQVFACGYDGGDRPSATAAAVTLSFPNGAIGAMTLGGIGAAAFKQFPRLDLACAQGQARLNGRDHMWTSLEWTPRDEGVVQRFEEEPERLGRTRYSAAFDHFIQAVKEDTPFETGLEDGAATVAMADAVYRSMNSGAAVSL